MKRYYFDLQNGDGAVPDDDGQLFESREQARAEAIRILQDVAQDEMPDCDFVKITVKVRDEIGGQMFEASLVLTSGWSV
ncbi:hypothetical protein EN962_05530 [Mesorhizobium sp. M7A.F.Ca.CA.001.09.2.1]|uniref:DUF6894 domain-containing protein n=2 Tax=Mesorhizobium TaxID=68287 RepID=A0AB38T5X3_9HYPH|nr:MULTISPECIES: hypothetical protein [Mesorhizobium]RUY15866.1 hypothetical protein EN981_39065 [Mesorhizobium sp. M7A.F.Ca.CA.001.13.2.1]RUZ32435.1 hypothetical protein EN953_15420 [Mesorhizobium sp. M7A.F.Ca.CA.001.04.1.1]MDF3217531.1 hypothetical protein [Mesorhizobium ciceri]RUY64387.1 hypothetical protein EN980_25445 [Mesorhizobium sp. M7A.F.Ca.CA.001.13.1.1]RUY64732.1 hypothetical protein EN965_20445 [Mesorhizobium sp. M7A.F.Ca.CA.001.05.1.1]